MHIKYRNHKQDGENLIVRFYHGGPEIEPKPYDEAIIPSATVSSGAEIIRYGDLCYAMGFENARIEHGERCESAVELKRLQERYESSQRAVDEFGVAYAKLNEIMALASSAWLQGISVDPNEIRKIAHRKDND